MTNRISVGSKHETKVSGRKVVVEVLASRSTFRIGRKLGFREEQVLELLNLSSGRRLRDVPPSRLGRRLEV